MTARQALARAPDRSLDVERMSLALREAQKGVGRTSPNPAVGAAIVRAGEVVALGYHRRAGTDHAEVAALRKLGFEAAGCELYSTLEPCDHQGRTGPCTEAIIRSGITRVVIGAGDPNPRVRGRGLRRLAKAGVEITRGVLEAECTALNETFNFSIVHHRPFVVLKAATSLDGRIATRTGHSQWITSPAARREGRRLRDVLDAVLVGVGTVLADDPSLTARVRGGRDPLRVVLDSRLRTPLTAKLVATARSTRTLMATTSAAPARKRKALEAAGVSVLSLPATAGGRVDLEALLAALYEREVNGLLVEGGATVHGAFVDARLVNKVVLFLAPLMIGGEGAPSAVAGVGAGRLEDALRLEGMQISPVGRDLMVTGYVR